MKMIKLIFILPIVIFWHYSICGGLFREEKQEIQKIRVGSLLDLSKGLKFVGRAFKQGIEYVINKANKQKNRKWEIELNVLDDQYTPEIAYEKIQRLVKEYQTDILLCPSGTPTLERCLPYIQEHKMLVLFPTSASLIFRKPDLTDMFHLVASDYDAGYAITKYMIEDGMLPQRIAFFYQNDAFGIDRINGAYKAIDEFGFSRDNVIAESYERNDLNFSPEMIKTIQDARVDSMGLFSTDVAARALIRRMGLEEMRKKKLFGSAELGSAFFADFLKEENLRIVISHEYPNPLDKELAIAESFRNDVAASSDAMALTTYCFAGYMAATLFIDVLNKVKGKITNKAIAEQLEMMKNYNFGGLSLTFDKQTRQLFHSVWLATGKDKWKQIPTRPSVGKEQRVVAKEPAKKKPEEQKDAVGPKKSRREEKIIRVGSTLDKSKGLKLMGLQYDHVMTYLISNQNKQGGIKGKEIRLRVLDDGYIPDRALANVQDLLTSYKTDIILLPTGTPTLESYINLVEEKKIIVLFPESGASKFHRPDLTNMVNLGASYYQEGYALVKYLITRKNAQKIAFFYQEDEFGKDLLRGGLQAIKDGGLSEKTYVEVPYDRNDLSFSDGIKRIKDVRVDSICLFSTAIAARSFIQQTRPEKIRDKKLAGCSDLGIGDFKAFVADLGLEIVISNIAPNPQIKKNPQKIINTFQQVAENSRGEINLDVISFQAFLGTSLFLKVLDQIEGAITKEKIIQEFEAMQDYNFGGLMLHFDKQTRQLLHSVWLDTGKPEWEKIEIAKKPPIDTDKKVERPKGKIPKDEEDQIGFF